MDPQDASRTGVVNMQSNLRVFVHLYTELYSRVLFSSPFLVLRKKKERGGTTTQRAIPEREYVTIFFFLVVFGWVSGNHV